ncbi:hypothetical protein ACQU0X_21405 [Pseudovibrio ascidiaceicola]|uniref:hypothetical protein n=1 Tax=Pseudovibrio ascidiaceicola TaxID=285279 RepID=UPI003D36EAFF
MKARLLPNSIAPSWGYFCRTDLDDEYVLSASPVAMDVFKAWVQGSAALHPLSDLEFIAAVIAPQCHTVEFSQFNEVEPFFVAHCNFLYPGVADVLAGLLVEEGRPFLMRLSWYGQFQRETVVDVRDFKKGPVSYLRTKCSQGRSELLQVYENSVLRAA